VHTLVGGGHKERRRSKVDGKEWRRPWRRVRVPGEGPVNMEGCSMYEHRGVVGTLFRYLVQLEVGRKGVVDVEVARVSPAAEVARLPSIPVAGGQEGSGGVARKLPRDDVVLMVGLAGAKEQWIAGMTVRPNGGGSSSSPVLWGTTLRCGKVKLDELVSYRESRWCYWSTGSWVGDGVGG
jgi:hypothetical protein